MYFDIKSDTSNCLDSTSEEDNGTDDDLDETSKEEKEETYQFLIVVVCNLLSILRQWKKCRFKKEGVSCG